MFYQTSYRKSLHVRNLALALALCALCAVGYKTYASMKKIHYTQAAEQAMKETDYSQAESYYHLSQLPLAINYGDPLLQQQMAALTEAREQAEAIADRLDAVTDGSAIDELANVYQAYVKTSAAYRDNQPASHLFQSTAKALAIEMKLSKAFTQAREQGYQQMAANVDQATFSNEPFFHTLNTIPADYYGAKGVKEQTLTERFRNYDRKKFATLFANRPFSEWIAAVQTARKQYDQENLEASWLKDLSERYGEQTLRADLRKDDLASFIKHAKDYESLLAHFSGTSAVQSLIQETIEEQLRYASSLVKRHRYDEAQVLYQTLAAYTDTSKEQSALEQSWLAQDPKRLLEQQYPSENWQQVFSGQEKDQPYVIALSEDKRLVYVSLQSDGQISQDSQRVSNSFELQRMEQYDQLLPTSQPTVILEGAGTDREHHYLIYAIQASKWVALFDIQADELAIEEPGQLSLHNPVGDGEGEIATYTWEDDTFKYAGKKADLESAEEPQENAETPTPPEQGEAPSPEQETEEQPSTESEISQPSELMLQQEALLFAQPNDELEPIGKLHAGTVVKVVERSGGWIKIATRQEELWIKQP